MNVLDNLRDTITATDPAAVSQLNNYIQENMLPFDLLQ
jgi:hypothetical protein